MKEIEYEHTPVDRCSNLTCPNRAHEGRFVVVESKGNVVGGFRPLRFLLCSPCAYAMKVGGSE